MEVIVLLAFVGLLLASGAVALFLRSVADRDWQHSERLSLLAIQDDAPPSAASPSTPGTTP